MRPIIRFWIATLACVLGIAVTLALGFWQWGRAADKLALQAAMQERKSLPALTNTAAAAIKDVVAELHRPVRLQGHWLPEHTVYLDNRQMSGRTGFVVLTPLRLADANTAVLVQRGWVLRDFQERTRLPVVATPAGTVVVEGRIAAPPARLHEFASPAPPGVIRQNLDLPEFARETALPLVPGLSVQQLGPPSEGLMREWPNVASGVGKHHGYAFQWWALAALIASLYVWFQFIAPRRRARNRAAA